MRPKPRFPAGIALKRTLESDTEVRRPSWSADGSKLATVGNDRRVRIWSGEEGTLLQTIALGWSADRIAWSPDNAQLAIIPNTSSELRLYDAQSGKPIDKRFTGHDGSITSVAWCPAAGLISTGSQDQFIGLWRADTGELLRALEGHTGAVSAVAWSPDGALLASASGDDKTVRMWDPETGAALWTYHPGGDGKSRVWNLVWFPDGATIATGWADHSIRLLEVATGREVGFLEWNDEPRSLSISADGSLLAVARGEGSKESPVRHAIWLCKTWQRAADFEEKPQHYAFQDLAFHPSQNLLATVVDYGVIRILELDVEKLRTQAREQTSELMKERPAVAAPAVAAMRDVMFIPPAVPETFDVFCCHNSVDKAAVKRIAVQLRQHGLRPWLDEWELRPGLPWQDTLQSQIQNIHSVAVFVGKSGMGPWQSMELRAFIDEFTRRGCPVIPVLLPDCGETPELPLFLRGMTWVDCRTSEPDPIARLVWGITGKTHSTNG